MVKKKAILMLLPLIAGGLAFALVRDRLDTPPTPANLLNEFHSYSTREDVRAQLRSAGLDWQVIKEGQPETPEGYLYIARVSGFSDLGVTGDLEFYFFRDQLMRMMFWSPNAEEYWVRLTQRQNLKVAAAPIGDVLLAHPNSKVEIWFNPPHAGRPVIAWSDTRLEREVSYRYD